MTKKDITIDDVRELRHQKRFAEASELLHLYHLRKTMEMEEARREADLLYSRSQIKKEKRREYYNRPEIKEKYKQKYLERKNKSK